MAGTVLVMFWRLSLLCDFSSGGKFFCLGCFQWKISLCEMTFSTVISCNLWGF